MAEVNKNNLPGGDIPLSFERLNQILNESGLLPNNNEEIPVAAPVPVMSPTNFHQPIIDDDKPLFDIVPNEPVVSFDMESNNKENKVSDSVIDIFLKDDGKMSDAVTPIGKEESLLNDYEEFLNRLDEIQLRKAIESANAAQKDGVPFEEFYKNLIDEYNETSSN